MENDSKNEQVKISFLGMKVECSNPTYRTMIIIILLLIFFVVLVLCLPKLALYKAMVNGLSRLKRLSG